MNREITVLLFICGVILGLLIVLILVSPAAAEVDLSKIAVIESSNNPMAWNKADDSRGMYQITPICLKEWNSFHPDDQYTMDDLWDVGINRRIADWYINERIPAMIKYYGKEVSTRNCIIAYNAGISYVAHDKPLPEITKQYLRKYGDQ